MKLRKQIRRTLFTTESRFRMPIRIGIAIAITILTFRVLSPVVQWIQSSINGGSVLFVAGSLRLVAYLGLAYLFIHILDRRQLRDYGIWPTETVWWSDLAIGFFIGAGVTASIALLELVFGWAQITGTFTTVSSPTIHSFFSLTTIPPFAMGLLSVTFFMMVIGITEEVAFRGYLLSNFEDGFAYFTTRYATPAAVIATSLPFAIAHITNPNTTVISTITTFLAGVWFATAYVLTGRLGLPIGLHTGWNLMIGVGMGLPVSGIHFPAVLVDFEAGGPEYITGGSYGPEGGLLGLLAVLGGFLLVIRYSRPESEYTVDKTIGNWLENE